MVVLAVQLVVVLVARLVEAEDPAATESPVGTEGPVEALLQESFLQEEQQVLHASVVAVCEVGQHVAVAADGQLDDHRCEQQVAIPHVVVLVWEVGVVAVLIDTLNLVAPAPDVGVAGDAPLVGHDWEQQEMLVLASVGGVAVAASDAEENLLVPVCTDRGRGLLLVGVGVGAMDVVVVLECCVMVAMIVHLVASLMHASTEAVVVIERNFQEDGQELHFHIHTRVYDGQANRLGLE